MHLMRALVVFLFSLPVLANPDWLSSAQKCQLIKSDKNRLACYDTIFSANSEKSYLKQSFGLEHKQKIAEQAPEKVEFVVNKVKKDPYGMHIITLENGHVWKQLDGRHLKLKKGDKIILIRGVLSSFKLQKVGSARTYRVKRVK